MGFNRIGSPSDDLSELEQTIDYLREVLIRHRIKVFWIFCAVLLLFLLAEIKELATLLLAAYGCALLLDPVVSHLERWRISRSLSIVAICLLLVCLIVTVFVVAVPVIIVQYQGLINQLPDYLRSAWSGLRSLLPAWLGISLPQDISELVLQVREHLSALGYEQIKLFVQTLASTMLQGYSIVLTIVNLCLFPFLLFYITRDLHLIHRFLGTFMSRRARGVVSSISSEILTHVYAFFKGQVTVCLILACLYVVAFSVLGLPWPVMLGVLTGLGNIVPYLGVGIGLLLSTILSLVSDPSIFKLGVLYLVFILLNFVEGSFLTPRIVGKSVGIHPLAVMLALIIGGQLFGLLGLVLAIPAAAAIRVLMTRMLEALEELPEDSELIISSE